MTVDKKQDLKKKTKQNPNNKITFLSLPFPGGSDGEASAYNSGDPGSTPG